MTDEACSTATLKRFIFTVACVWALLTQVVP
jgi:hypothetical protein